MIRHNGGDQVVNFVRKAIIHDVLDGGVELADRIAAYAVQAG